MSAGERRWVALIAVVVLAGCGGGEDCPAELPSSDEVRLSAPAGAVGYVGEPVHVDWKNPERVAPSCVAAFVEGPDGGVRPARVFPGAERDHLTVVFDAEAPGVHRVLATARTTMRLAPEYIRLLRVERKPLPATACLRLPRPCASVVSWRGRIACDESLFDETGQELARLDGGEWVGEGDALFAWEGELLTRVELGDGGVVRGSVTPVPHGWWAAEETRLAVGDADGGLVLDTSSEPPRVVRAFRAIAGEQGLQFSAGMLVHVGSRPEAVICFDGRRCVRFLDASSVRFASASPSGVVLEWPTPLGPQLARLSPELASPFGDWLFSNPLWRPLALDRISSRPLGLVRGGVQVLDDQLDGVGPVIPLDGSTTFGATERFVWVSHPTHTSLFCH